MLSERLKRILDSYEDFELAYVSKSLAGYMDETQTAIKAYLIERGLTEERINQLVQENEARSLPDDSNCCPRCKSKKFTTESVEITNGRVAAYDGLIGRANYTTQTVCSICGYRDDLDSNQEDTKQAFFLLRLGKALLRLLGIVLRFLK